MRGFAKQSAQICAPVVLLFMPTNNIRVSSIALLVAFEWWFDARTMDFSMRK